jgi:hypothetical protein
MNTTLRLLIAAAACLSAGLAFAQQPPASAPRATTPSAASPGAAVPAAPPSDFGAPPNPDSSSPLYQKIEKLKNALEGPAPDSTRSLDQQIQDVKKDVVDLNKDLFVLEEELLFPANTQVAVFVSVDVGDFFALDSITLKIDNRDVMNYLYTPRETAALLKGGVQRLYVGNLKAGEHELVAFFNGKGPHDRNYKRGANLKFEKGVGAKYLELKVTDHEHAQEPEFEIKDWE